MKLLLILLLLPGVALAQIGGGIEQPITDANFVGTLSVAKGGTGATNAADARANLGLSSAATNGASAFQPASSVLTNLANNNASGLTNISISGVVGLQTNLDSRLITNGSAAALTNFPSIVLQTNTAVTSFPAGLLRTNGSAAGLTSFPTLNQNTTGTASNVTGIVSITNGGTGTNTASGARTALGITALVNALSQPRNVWDVNSLLYNGTAAPTNGASIQNWYTTVMHNAERVFSQATATNRPTFNTNVQNGMPGLLFDGAGDEMNTVGWNSLFNRAGSTILIVCRPTAQATNGSGTTWQRPQLIADQGGFIGLNVNPASGTSNFITAWAYDDNGAQAATSAAIATNTTILATMRYGDGVIRVQINTNAAVTNALRNYATAISGPTMIGRGYEAQTTYAGYIFEVVTIGRAITDDELSAYQSALMTKWGL